MSFPEYFTRFRFTLCGFRFLGMRWLTPCLGYLLHPLLRRVLPGRRLSLRGFHARVGSDDFFVLGQLFREYDIRHVSEYLRSADLLIDAGANVGAFSWLARQLNPQIPMIAIEPESANFRSLTHQPTLESNTRFIHAALGPEPGHLFLVVSENSATHQTTTDPAHGVHVPAVILDELVGNAKRVLLKLDIEGAEKAILEKGIPASIFSVVMEWHHSSPPPPLRGGTWTHRGENSYTWLAE